MKETHKRVSLARLCILFGITRQAYYQYFWYAEELSLEHHLVLGEVTKIRKRHPRMGGRKLYLLLDSFLIDHQIKMGRDAVFNLLATHNLLVKRRKKRAITTNSCHWLRKYPNKIRDLIPERPNQVWVSDLTYWRISSGFIYLSLITDAFSHKIVGYNLSDKLDAGEALKALEMALCRENPVDLIHHSDRGYQYCWYQYVKTLENHNVAISMTENSDPLENAIAERVNGILKEEYLECYSIADLEQATKSLELSVSLYNTERPHMSIGNNTPDTVHNEGLKTDKKWKNYYKKVLQKGFLEA